jgi:hypothetical protein
MAVVDRIIDHLKLTFAAEKPPPEAVLPKLLREADLPSGILSRSPGRIFSVIVVELAECNKARVPKKIGFRAPVWI